jgi:hypothetical protein
MNSFNTQLHSDETPSYVPTAEDMAEYEAFLDGELDAANAELAEVAAEEATHDEDGNYIWSDEALAFEDEMDNLYDDDEDDEDYEDDGQPTMYEEYQDLYGGDDWDHGQYDEY